MVNNNAAAKAGAEKHAHHRARFAFEFQRMNTKREQIAIVLHLHRPTQTAVEQSTNRHIFPADVGGAKHAALMNNAGNAHANGTHLGEANCVFGE